ncbi:recombinase family protein [Plantactinospora sp. CA-294935]|uniref:recombinase family protein n=1 Tax=Plantactinospora sp. CA-294935 TaxID=3240012 RepID=UPI003D90EB82
MRCYGYDETGRHIVPHEAEVIKEVVRRLLGPESMRSIVADLRKRGILTSASRPWTQQSLSRLLRNPRLAGFKTYLGEIVGKGEWKPILDDPDEYQKLMDLLGDPSRKQPGATNVRKYLLSGGFLVCGFPLPDDDGDGTHACGKTLYTQPSNSGKRGYVCRSGSPSYGCGRIRIAAENLEEEVTVRALARLGSPKVRARLEAAVGAVALGTEHIAAAVEAIEERLEEAGKAYAQREISLSTLKSIDAGARQERKSLMDNLKQAERLRTLPATTPDALAAWWVDAPLERRRDLLALVLERVVVKPATRAGVIRLDLDRLEFVWK